MRYVIASALAITAAVDFFSVRSISKVINRKQNENKMDMLSCTDYTYINVRLSCQVSGCSYDGPSYPPYNTGSFVRSAWRRPPDPNPNPNAMYGVTCAWMLWVVNWM